mgnify:FL=1|jgi:uncharacterized membrane protein YbhN (UPF0104 family)
MSNKEKESLLITIQIISSIVSIGTVIISIILLYNEQLEINNEEPFLDAEAAQKLTTFNRILILIIFIVFLVINYILYDISKEEGEDLKPYELQIIASYFSLFAASIALYVVLLQRSGEQVVDVENPII